MLKGKTTGKEVLQQARLKEEGVLYSLVQERTIEKIEQRLEKLLTDTCIQVTKIMTASEWRNTKREYVFAYEDTPKQQYRVFAYNYFVVVKHIKP